MTKVLVTGSSGLVGSSLARALRECRYDVAGFDLRGQGPERGDVRSREHVRLALEGVDGVVQYRDAHGAADALEAVR